MNASRFFTCAGVVVSLSILSACNGASGGEALAPANAGPDIQYHGTTAYVNGRAIAAARPYLNASRAYVPVVSSELAQSNASSYEYLINFFQTNAGIFDYPKSDVQTGTIANVGGQGCTNVLYGYGNKTFWIVAAANQIAEYRAKDTLVKTLEVDSGSDPSSCSMNADGDLAVGILAGTNSGDVVVFKKASGSGTVIPTTLIREYFAGYDNHGNLFVDGLGPNYVQQIAEIPKGGGKARVITTSNTIGFVGSVQWDGSYLTIGDQDANVIYRYTVKGKKATLHGTVPLTGASDCAQTWIATGVVYCADAGTDGGEVFSYPAGGSALAVFSGSFDLPLGAVAVTK
jgi:hypothetical protein